VSEPTFSPGEPTTGYYIESRLVIGLGIRSPWRRGPVGWATLGDAAAALASMRRDPDCDYRIAQVQAIPWYVHGLPPPAATARPDGEEE
jgi:hypothetical protein